MTTGRLINIRWLVLALVLIGSAFVSRESAQAEAATDISSAGPLTHVYVGAQLGCQVAHTLDGSTLEFYFPGSIPGDCGTFLVVDGTMFAPDLTSHITASGGIGAITPFTPVSQSGVTGAGTFGDPYKVTTVVDAGATGIHVTQTDSYVIGDESYRTDRVVSNTSGATKSVLVYHAADCYLGGSDFGYGYANAVTKTVACTKTADNTPPDRIEQFSPITPADHYYEAHYSSVWFQLGMHTNLPDTCTCATNLDNGIAINWDRTLADGTSVTLSQFTTFSPLGNQPLVASKTADAAASTGGGTNGYTITITNPNATPVTVNTIQDTLPAGFSYVAGSTTGVTTSDPGIVGQVLTWTGPFALAGGGSISLHFNVTVSSTSGTYFNDATGTATVDVVPTGPTAPIVVTAVEICNNGIDDDGDTLVDLDDPDCQPDSLTPPTVDVTLPPGGSTTIAKRLHLAALPAKADICIAIDTTGSMGSAIEQAKSEAVQVVSEVQSQIPGARFCVIDFKDYAFSPYGGPGDYPYLLTSPLTGSAVAVQNAINLMSASGGGDGPESYNRVFFEAYSDPALVYDPTALKFLVVLGDNVPHDPTQTVAPSCGDAPPVDPGRDAIPGNGDDLETEATIAGLNTNNITLLMINYFGFALQCHEELAAAAGGDAFSGGGGADLSHTIVNAVVASGSHINEIHLVVSGPVCPPVEITFNPPNPPPYGPPTGFDAPVDVLFDEIITVPVGTPGGEYLCTVTAVVDGAARASQSVRVVVQEGPACPADDDDDNDDDGVNNEEDEDDDNDGQLDIEDADDDNDSVVDETDADDDNDNEGDDDDDFDNDGLAASVDGDDDNDGQGDTEDTDDDNDGIDDGDDGDDDNDGEADEVDDDDGDDDPDPTDDCDTDDDNDGVDDGNDNCQTVSNLTQNDQDGDGDGDACDDGDGDGFVDAKELRIGTGTAARCGGNGWPADLVSGGLQPNTLNLVDLASFIAPVRRLETNPGDSGYDGRWDLMPGSPFGNAINLVDIASLIGGETAHPPMFNGARAFGATCTP